MCCTELRRIAQFAVSVAMVTVSGCYSMNGYMMNASGLGYYDNGNYAMASQEFQAAVASNPRNPDYLANLARTRMKMGDPAGAERLYQQALAVSPSHQPSYHGYSELLLAQNRGPDALRMMNSWAATQPYIPESHVELAWLQRELGQPDAAAQSLQTALQMNPNHATALAHLGQYYQDQGNAAQAVALYQRSLHADWNQPHVHSRLAMAADAAGPGHPMSEMAMARGVHPHTVARKRMAFGNPWRRKPKSSRGLPQQQLAWQPSQPVSAVPWQNTAEAPHWPESTVTQYQPEIPSPAYGPMMPFNGDSLTTSVDGPVHTAPANVSPGSAPSDAASPLPMPDPAFTETPAMPVMSISSSAELDSSEPPEVEAF